MRSHADTPHPRRTRSIAALAALALHLLLLLALTATYLSYPRPDTTQAEPMQPNPVTVMQVDEIAYDFDPSVIDHIMAGEAVEQKADEPYGSEIPDAVDAGKVNEAATPVATPEPSPVKVAEKPKANQAVSDRISDRTGNAFGKRTKGDPEQVKDDSRELHMTIANSPGARSEKQGKIVFRVNINGDGIVSGKPTLLRAQCEGEASQDDAIVNRCRTIAAQQRFAVVVGSPTQLGTVTFTFTDKK